MKPDNYLVTCLKCKGQSRLAVINGKDIMYKDHVPIISSRLRGDLSWGFQCQCGNDSLVAPEEVKELNFLVQNTNAIAKASTIRRISEQLRQEPRNLFKMERV